MLGQPIIPFGKKLEVGRWKRWKRWKIGGEG